MSHKILVRKSSQTIEFVGAMWIDIKRFHNC